MKEEDKTAIRPGGGMIAVVGKAEEVTIPGKIHRWLRTNGPMKDIW